MSERRRRERANRLGRRVVDLSCWGSLGPFSREGSLGPFSRQGGNERGRPARRSPGTQALQASVASRSAQRAAGAEPGGGFRGVHPGPWGDHSTADNRLKAPGRSTGRASLRSSRRSLRSRRCGAYVVGAGSSGRPLSFPPWGWTGRAIHAGWTSKRTHNTPRDSHTLPSRFARFTRSSLARAFLARAPPLPPRRRDSRTSVRAEDPPPHTTVASETTHTPPLQVKLPTHHRCK